MRGTTMSPDGIHRRSFLVGGAAALTTAVAITAVTAATTATAHAATAAAPRAAVLEYLDQWTKATGLAELLRRAGFTVVPLDPTLPATAQGVDLIAFGSFTNNGPVYPGYVTAQAASLRDFAAAGGTVLDLAQSDQLGAAVTYLPSELAAVRTDADYDTVLPVATDHPLVAALPVVGGRVLTGRSTSIRVSWETVGSWRSMRVLLACTTGGTTPALLEGAHGTGRFLVTSLTVDKCFNSAGTAVQPAAAVQDSSSFFTALAGYVAAVRAGTAPAVVPTPMPAQPPVGPLVGHVDTGSARIWARPGLDPVAYPTWRCTVRRADGWSTAVDVPVSTANDNTLLVDVAGLQPATRYEFTIAPVAAAPGFALPAGSFTTSPAAGAAAVVTMGLGSCAPSDPNSVWTRIVDEGCDSFVMLGDNPYIDSGDLAVARTKHRTFLAQPELAHLIATTPTWFTWDDHDFGTNGVNGSFSGKANTRTAFVDYRANASFGHAADGTRLTTRTAGQGVYTSFRRGPVEVFLLDPRWFSTTAPSFADPTKTTCIGQVQWDWLRAALRASTAPFKAIASGMIWDDKGNAETDDWATYQYEKDAILDFLAAEKIPGCFLVSGDIHSSQALNYGPRIGYDLWQFVVSPLHGSTISGLNAGNPALVASAVQPYTFLKLVADTTVSPATLTATWIDRDGKRLFEVRRTATELGHPA
ncbi:alkaline phosphatase D family protein [Kitasatospora sp. YST-16]|uniref:alkaline phosphatase D family protein n=1 Tax=Kitasatospora sp. YST-16 TaxID=2998080 RepID=UPI0022836002|nr:alkaline phosphatase D family protein [Kitasatospora sp. YST-16]WAL71487.1 alkaline phosphatase D family protein [Kitasatospora sp. YST-16]WNW37527.1 alkaline phosphatase D family protein [Streptomyces sp. Li-HN-5-13]